MREHRIFLFGKFQAVFGSDNSSTFVSNANFWNLLYFLILHKGPHSRDKVASTLWRNWPAEQAKKYLRQSLWQLQKGLADWQLSVDELIVVDSDWVQINPNLNIWVDAIHFEQVYTRIRGLHLDQIQQKDINQLKANVDLYTADLLENLNEDWCILERERFRHMFLVSLDLLMNLYEGYGQFDLAIEQGMKSLLHNPVREHTYQNLMRLQALQGDRKTAIKLYDMCQKVLKEELGVTPSDETMALCKQIREGTCLSDPKKINKEQKFKREPEIVTPQYGMAELTNHVIDLKRKINDLQKKLESHLQRIDNLIN